MFRENNLEPLTPSKMDFSNKQDILVMSHLLLSLPLNGKFRFCIMDTWMYQLNY